MSQVTTPAGALDPRRELARRAIDGAMEAITRAGGSFDRGQVGASALEEMVGLGVLAGLIEDQSAQDIIIHGPDSIVVDRGAGLAPYEGYFSSPEALGLIVSRLVYMSGATFDFRSALHEGTLPNGVHFTAALPPVAIGGPIVELRRTFRPGLTGDQLVARGMLSNEMFEVLRRGARGRKNVVVVGTSDGGVRQLLSALANLVGDEERVLTIEDVPSLELSSPNALRLAVGPGTAMEHVITQGGRMRADRIVIDGVRGGEALAALMQLSARGGCMLGVHSAPGGNALDHLIALARMSGAGEGIGRVVASAVQLIVRVGRGSDGIGRVESVAEVMPDGAGGARVNEIFRGFAAVGQPQTF
jgi:pilus assembly protein CpaF